MSAALESRSSAVVLMAYGGPDCLDAVGPFMCELTGREPSPEVLGRVQARYQAIGGASPLPDIAYGFADALELKLAEEGVSIPVLVGFRYTPPMLGEVVRDLYRHGVRRLIAVSLSPFESRSTSRAYGDAVREVLPDLPGLDVEFTPAFGTIPVFATLHARALDTARRTIDAPDQEVLTVFTAHSLPVSDLETPELYASGLRTVASAIAAELGMEPGVEFSASERLPDIETFGAPDSARPWVLAYQSKGMRPGEWLGPELDALMDLAAARGFSAIVVSPIGFATEHMETRYDLDIEAVKHANALGIGFARAMVPNSAPELIAAVSGSVRELLDTQG